MTSKILKTGYGPNERTTKPDHEITVTVKQVAEWMLDGLSKEGWCPMVTSLLRTSRTSMTAGRGSEFGRPSRVSHQRENADHP